MMMMRMIIIIIIIIQHLYSAIMSYADTEALERSMHAHVNNNDHELSDHVDQSDMIRNDLRVDFSRFLKCS